MKKGNIAVITMFIVLLACVIFSSAVSSSAQQSVDKKADKEFKDAQRIENMLNTNRLYNDDFYNETTVIQESAIALIDKADNGYIPVPVLEQYISGMYSMTVDFNAYENKNVEFKEGCIPVPVCGYTEYTHKIKKITDNGDGTITVISKVKCDYHDSKAETKTCETLFCVCQNSAFGYNIIYSNIK